MRPPALRGPLPYAAPCLTRPPAFSGFEVQKGLQSLSETKYIKTNNCLNVRCINKLNIIRALKKNNEIGKYILVNNKNSLDDSVKRREIKNYKKTSK